MVTKMQKIQAANALSLLALKTAPDVFDLSSGLSYLSVRDQMVRGRILARDIAKGMPKRKRILVVGAGAAGVSFACAAAQCGLDVIVVDSRRQPVELQENAKRRYIGPHMYEWPAGFCADQIYPGSDPVIWELSDDSCPQWGTKHPVNGPTFVSQVREWLTTWLASKHLLGQAAPRFLMSVRRRTVENFVRDFICEAQLLAGKTPHELPLVVWGRPWPGTFSPSRKTSFRPDLVVLAGGMGTEITQLEGLPGGKGFWEDEPAARTNQNVAVFGAGDGAVQEVLLCLTKFRHPLDFLRRLRKTSAAAAAKIEEAESALLSIDAQHKLEASWTVGLETAWLDQRCEELAKAVTNAAPAAVGALLRDRTANLTLVTRETHLTRCYLLNRFVFHIAKSYFELAGTPKWFSWKSGVDVASAIKPPKQQYKITLSTGAIVQAHRIFVRWGIGKGDSGPPGLQLVGLSDAKRAKRTSLGQLPLPFVLPKVA